MNKKTLSLTALAVLSLFSTSINAQTRSKESSRNIARHKLLTEETELALEDESLMVFNNKKQKGFVIVSAREEMPEVLGYSDNGNFDPENIPAGMKAWMECIKMATDAVASGRVSANEVFVTRAEGDEIQPLLGNIMWDQESPYNLKCPVDEETGKHTVTGCAATAMAMMMRYYKYPEHGTGTVRYTSKTNRFDLSYNFAETTFDWDKMNEMYSMPYFEKTDAEEVNEEPSSNIVYEDLAATATTGNIEITVKNIINGGIPVFNGEMQFLLYDQDGNFLESIGKAEQINDLPYSFGYGEAYFDVSMPNKYADGDYLIYLAFMPAGEEKWSISNTIDMETYNTGNPKPLTITKSGNTIKIGDMEGFCAYTAEETDAVSELMFACGVALKMDYGINGSSSSVDGPFSAAIKYFGYDKDACMPMSDHMDTEAMNDLIIEQLQNNRPVYLGGITSTNLGHAFIADGLRYTVKGNPQFHINWGWSGMSNGYFLLTNLSPENAGAGGNSKDNYSNTLYIICDMMPEDGVDCGSSIGYKSITCSKNEAQAGDRIDVSAKDVMNISAHMQDVTIDVYAVAEDGNATRVGSLGKMNFDSYYYVSFDETRMVLPSTLPQGTYNLELRPADWTTGTPGRSIGPKHTIFVSNVNSLIETKEDLKDSDIFDLNGRRVKAASDKGIFIQDGRLKVIGL